jgi:hypothetical protein
VPVPTPELIDELVETDAAPCVSITMPTHRAGPETRQDPIRLKNLLGEAQERLEEMGLRRPEAADIIAGPRRLLEDHEFWQHRTEGLAVFAAPGFERLVDLDEPAAERAEAHGRFLVTPLLSSLDRGPGFLVLALGLKHVRLIEATLHHHEDADLGDTPGSLEDALWYLDRESQLQYHEAGRTMFHGHGGPEEPSGEDVAAFLRLVAEGVDRVRAGRTMPVVVAAVERLQAAFRSVAGDLDVLGGGIDGNPDERPSSELHREATELVRPVFEAPREDAAARYAALAGTGRTGRETGEVLEAAEQGRVEALFVPTGVTPEVDAAASSAWKTGAEVYVADEVPGHGPLAAVYRW